MKNIVLSVLVFALGISLVACQSNTRSQNTGVGAVAGAVVGGVAGSAFGAGTGQAVAVGVGAVTGAIVGGAIGHNMDSSDNTKVNRTMDYTPTNKKSTWTNKKTHASYTVKPTSGMLTVNGNPNCRKFTTNAMINGAVQEDHGVACRQANGQWQSVTKT